MNKRLKALAILLVVFSIIAIGHSALHIYIWGTGISGLYENGQSVFSIGGLAIGEEKVGEEKVGEEKTGIYSVDVSLSQLFVIGEWIVVLIFFTLLYIGGKVSFKKEIRDLKIRKAKKIPNARTDIDKLYEILKEKKKIRFIAIEKAFDVDEEIVEGWARTLEMGNLATIDFPRIGKPELVLVEKKSHSKKK